jgi:hypothetical protein
MKFQFANSPLSLPIDASHIHESHLPQVQVRRKPDTIRSAPQDKSTSPHVFLVQNALIRKRHYGLSKPHDQVTATPHHRDDITSPPGQKPIKMATEFFYENLGNGVSSLSG